MDINQVLQSFGLPAAVMVAIGLAGWKSLGWAARMVAEPLIKKHMEFMDKTSETFAKQTELLVKMDARIDGIETTMASACKFMK